MAGIADLMYGSGYQPAQAFAVPDPRASMADILAGGTPAAAPVPGGVMTAYGDSPAPGAVAAAGQQANAAASQEPGILDRARNWATQNPVQAQALMQGFAALASGRTRGGFVQQMGQAAGVANQTMVEQTAANAAQQRDIDEKNRRMTLQERETNSQISNRDAINRRAEALHPGQVEAQDLTNEGRSIANDAAMQRTDQDKRMFTPKMKELDLRLRKLDSDLAMAPTEQAAAKLRLDRARLEHSIYQQYGPAEAEMLLRTKGAQANAAEERSSQETMQTDRERAKDEAIAKLPEEERNFYYRNGKPKEGKPQKTAQEIAMELYSDDPSRFKNKDGSLNHAMLQREVQAIQAGGAAPAATTDAWAKARNAVKPGQPYIGPDGREYVRK